MVECCTFHELCPLACSDSELTSETMNPFRHFGRIPWTGDRPIVVGKLKGKEQLEDLGTYERVTLELILEK